MNGIKLMLVVFTIASIPLHSIAQSGKKSFIVSFYNVENLFDTIHNPHKMDKEFTPEGRKQWTSERYNQKLEHLSRVLAMDGSKTAPGIIGLCEIENRQVVLDLSNSKALKKAHYKLVHQESPDIRGIDVALLYRPKLFKLISKNFYTVKMKENKRFKTRDILYAKLYSKKAKDTLHIFVNHWPSRRGGEAKSSPKRMAAALTLRHQIDSIQKHTANAKIIIMGDMNDEPNNKSITQGLRAQNPHAMSNYSKEKLYNLSFGQDQKGLGTYYYWKTKEWNFIDNMIISGNLLSGKNGCAVSSKDVQIYKENYFLIKNKNGVLIPNKTYAGKYKGGYSDHLPVYIIINIRRK